MSDKVILKNLFLFLFLISLNKVSSAENIYIGVASNFFGPIKIIKEESINENRRIYMT
jgi:hypothetical protein